MSKATDIQIRYALSDAEALALTIFGEARGEPIEGKVFVGSVVRNRVSNPRRFGSTYRAVCHAHAQFSCWWAFGGETNFQRVMEMARALVAHQPLPLATQRDVELWAECQFVAEGIIGGQLRDNARGADHYLTAALFRSRPPAWAKGRTPDVRVGSHVGFVGG